MHAAAVYSSPSFCFDLLSSKPEARVVTAWLADLVIDLYSTREDCRDMGFMNMVKCLQRANNTTWFVGHKLVT